MSLHPTLCAGAAQSVCAVAIACCYRYARCTVLIQCRYDVHVGRWQLFAPFERPLLPAVHVQRTSLAQGQHVGRHGLCSCMHWQQHWVMQTPCDHGANTQHIAMLRAVGAWVNHRPLIQGMQCYGMWSLIHNINTSAGMHMSIDSAKEIAAKADINTSNK